KKELEDKKKILELRLESIEKQEKLLEKKVIEFKEESSKEKKD
ncbi:prefoldin subunit beta, partial [Candidatus Parvarchaeota archaeon]